MQSQHQPELYQYLIGCGVTSYRVIQEWLQNDNAHCKHLLSLLTKKNILGKDFTFPIRHPCAEKSKVKFDTRPNVKVIDQNEDVDLNSCSNTTIVIRRGDCSALIVVKLIVVLITFCFSLFNFYHTIEYNTIQYNTKYKS